MKHLLAIATREITERRAILIAALVGGLLPFASPLLPGVASGRAGEARDAMALGIALAFAGATALAMGATAVGRDLAERRMTFDFARPLSWGAIWGGRFLGAIALTLFVAGAVLLPSAVIGPLFPSLSGTNLPLFLLAAAGVLVAIIPLAHAGSIAIRSRSRWLAVDLVCGVLVALAGAWVARELVFAMALQTLHVAAAVLGPLVIVVFWVGSARQVAIGRTDLRRGHAALSQTVWSCLLVLATVLLGYTGWLLAVAPDDLTRVSGSPAPRGSWSLIEGRSPGRGDYVPALLFDTATRRFTRVGPAARLDLRFSADGKRAIFLKPLDTLHPSGTSRSGYEIGFADLGAAGATVHETSLTLNGQWPVMGVSDDGRRVAILDGTTLTVYEVDTGKTLATAKTPEAQNARARRSLRFAGADHVRLLTLEPRLEIYELDVLAKRLEKTGDTQIELEFASLQSLPGDRLFVHEVRSHERAFLLDGRTGTVLQVYLAKEGGKAKFRRLADGRVVAIDAAGSDRSIRILAEDGREERRVALEDSGRVITGGEVAAGKLVLSAGAPKGDSPDLEHWRVLLLDADAGDLRETARGLVPWISDHIAYLSIDLAAPGEPATRLFASTGGVVFHDPLTGETRTLAGTGPAL